MDQHSAASLQGAPQSTGGAVPKIGPKRSFASRLFGYDIFLSFALGPPPRGTHSYASDLARRLRERDFSVFFSEDEASPGEQLDSSLRASLLRSKILVVVANRGTLEDPRWVRTEVEEFRKHHPNIWADSPENPRIGASGKFVKQIYLLVHPHFFSLTALIEPRGLGLNS